MKKQLEELRDLAYETGYIAGRIESGTPMDEEHHRKLIAKRNALLESIAAAVEEEMSSLVTVRDMYATEIESLRADNARLTARVAEMSGVLHALIDAAIDRVEHEQGDDILELRIHEANAVLAGAPRVVYTKRLEFVRDPENRNDLAGWCDEDDGDYTVYILGNWQEIVEDREYEVFVVERPPEGKQPADSEQEATDA